MRGVLSYIERGVFPGGCFFAQLPADFDAAGGPIHDQLVVGQRGWLRVRFPCSTARFRRTTLPTPASGHGSPVGCTVIGDDGLAVRPG